jgi:hypothetical protein
MQPGEITWQDLRRDCWQSYVEREERMDKYEADYQSINRPARAAEQAKLPLAPAASTHGAKCVKCGRVFTVPGQYRYRGADGAAICRDARACAVRAEGR